MWRTALRPRWLGLLLLVIALDIGFVELGLWQLGVARDSAHVEQAQRVAALPTADLPDILAPHTVMDADAVGRSVRVTGHYDTAQQVLVAPRRMGERPGLWVVTPLVVDGTGARVAVLRGFVGDAPSAPAPPAGTVTVTGKLSPPESAPNDPVPLPEGQIQTVDLATLVNRWNSSVYNALVFTSAESAGGAPVTGAPAAALSRVPPPELFETGVSWRNLAYALQWWLFAGFALYMWGRMVADDHRTRLLLDAQDAAEGDESDTERPGAESHPDSARLSHPVRPGPADGEPVAAPAAAQATSSPTSSADLPEHSARPSDAASEPTRRTPR